MDGNVPLVLCRFELVQLVDVLKIWLYITKNRQSLQMRFTKGNLFGQTYRTEIYRKRKLTEKKTCNDPLSSDVWVEW